MIRVTLWILTCFALGLGFALWFDPSPLTALLVLAVVWLSVFGSSWGLCWLASFQQRRWMSYWHHVPVVDASCDFYCVPDHCAVMQARCARAGQAAMQRERTTP